MKKLLTLILFFAIVITLWGLRASIVDAITWLGNREAVTATMEQVGLWGPVVLFLLLILQVFFAFIPGQALMLACVYIYGFWGGFLLAWFSLVAGGEMAFWLARQLGRPFAERWISPQVLSKWDKAAEGQGIGFFSLSLVLPIFPNDAMCYVAGLGKISSRRFLISNMLGRGMACLLTSVVGAFSGEIPWQGWAVFIAVILLTCLGWQIAKNRKSNLSNCTQGDCHVNA